MSTPNFRTQRQFPLYVNNDPEIDYWDCKIMQEELDGLNRDFDFFKISVEGGHYYGVQLYVEACVYAQDAGFDEDGDEYATNEDCRYYLDMYLSQAKRRYAAEVRKVNKAMERFAKAWDFEEYLCTAIFSNGEAIYEPANSLRAQVKNACLGAA